MTDDLVSWLRARLNEDERDWLIVRDQVLIQPMFAGRHLPTAALADIAAKRASLDLLAVTEERTMPTEAWVIAKQVLRLLASAYSTRPGYREEWRP